MTPCWASAESTWFARCSLLDGEGDGFSEPIRARAVRSAVMGTTVRRDGGVGDRERRFTIGIAHIEADALAG